MAITYEHVVPWGRNLDEYRRMFGLSDPDLRKKIVGFGDGPASFNCEMKRAGHSVTSIDPIYRFSRPEIQDKISTAKEAVIGQTRANMDKFVWKNIGSLENLVEIRMQAMRLFLDDFDAGKSDGRYIVHELPEKTGFPDGFFDIGLSSHFLLFYSQLGTDFHIRSISEMLRCCGEVRIFPILNLNAQKSEVLDDVTVHFRREYDVRRVKVEYEFQKNGNEMLVIGR